jgi:hypothetical protein
MSLLSKLMTNAKKAEIGFGIHEDCVITNVNNDRRKNKDGEIVKRNCYTTIGKLDKEGNIASERIISWFDWLNTSEYVYSNFEDQLLQLTSIIDLYHPITEKKDVWGDAFSQILEDEEIDESKEAIEKALKNKQSCSALLEAIGDTYIELLSSKVGEKSDKIRVKVVYEKSGKYLQQPKFDKFVESMEVNIKDSILKISPVEESYKAKSLLTGSAPKTNSKL